MQKIAPKGANPDDRRVMIRKVSKVASHEEYQVNLQVLDQEIGVEDLRKNISVRKICGEQKASGKMPNAQSD